MYQNKAWRDETGLDLDFTGKPLEKPVSEKGGKMNQEITAKAISFVRSFAEKRFGLTLEGEIEVKEAGDNQTTVEFKIADFKGNLLFSEYMKSAQVEFRLTENEHGVFIWDVMVSFSFKDGGGNAWTHPTAFMLKNGDFVEKEKQ